MAVAGPMRVLYVALLPRRCGSSTGWPRASCSRLLRASRQARPGAAAHTEDELANCSRSSAAETGTIDSERAELLERALAMTEKTARQVLVPAQPGPLPGLGGATGAERRRGPRGGTHLDAGVPREPRPGRGRGEREGPVLPPLRGAAQEPGPGAAAGALRPGERHAGAAAWRSFGSGAGSWRWWWTSTEAPSGIVSLADVVAEVVGEVAELGRRVVGGEDAARRALRSLPGSTRFRTWRNAWTWRFDVDTIGGHHHRRLPHGQARPGARAGRYDGGGGVREVRVAETDGPRVVKVRIEPRPAGTAARALRAEYQRFRWGDDNSRGSCHVTSRVACSPRKRRITCGKVRSLQPFPSPRRDARPMRIKRLDITGFKSFMDRSGLPLRRRNHRRRRAQRLRQVQRGRRASAG